MQSLFQIDSSFDNADCGHRLLYPRARQVSHRSKFPSWFRFKIVSIIRSFLHSNSIKLFRRNNLIKNIYIYIHMEDFRFTKSIREKNVSMEYVY